MRNFFTIWRRELAGCFLSPVAYVTMVLFIGAAGGTFMTGVIRNNGSQATLPAILYSSVLMWATVLITVISMRLFTEEKRSGTIETLMTAPVTETAVVLGKYAGALTFLLVVTVPVVGCMYILAEMSPGVEAIDTGCVLAGGLIVLLISGLCVSVGLVISLTTKNQIIAAICCFAAIWLVILAGWLITVLPCGGGAGLADYIATDNHLGEFSRGIVDTRAVALYLSGTVFMLFVGVRMLESRRWR